MKAPTNYRNEIRKRTVRGAPQVGTHHGEGPSDGAQRNARIAAMNAERREQSRINKETIIAKRTAAAEKRKKETLAMATEDTKLNEAIKGWKHAGRDLMKHRADAYNAKQSAVLVSLKKDGEESKMHDAKSYHASEDDARKKHADITKLNPTRKIRHNLYVDGKKVATLGEETNTEARTKIKNVARLNDAKPTSKESTLAKTGEIKTKKIDEGRSMSINRNFGLPESLIAATRALMEKKHDADDMKSIGKNKTEVDTKPTTDDQVNDGDDDVKKESKHTTPKSDKEKKLAALAHPKDKITHKDVLVGRGVVKEEEIEEAIKPYVSYSGPRLGKSPSATVMAANEKHTKMSEFEKLAARRAFQKNPANKGKPLPVHLQTDQQKQKAQSKITKEEAIKPYVSYSGPRLGKSPSATVMAANEKPHKTFTKDEHGHDYKQKAVDYFKKNLKKLHSEEVEQVKEEEIEEAEQIDELKHSGIISRYMHKVKQDVDSGTASPKRKAGYDLALKKKWGDKRYGMEEPRVRATSEEFSDNELARLEEIAAKFDIQESPAPSTERGLQDHEPRIVSGVKGMKSKPFSKKFPHAKAMDKWMDSDDYGDHEVHRIEKA